MALQHISDNMLRKMRRDITKAETIDLIADIRRQVPDIHLRTTLLLGHPHEEEEDFEELKEFVEAMRFERLGAFAYSHEEGTFADRHYRDEIPFDVKNRRLSEIMDIQERIADKCSVYSSTRKKNRITSDVLSTTRPKWTAKYSSPTATN